MVRCGEGYDRLLRRPLSIHSVVPGKGVALLFAVVGHGTAWLSRRQEGAVLDFWGPLGRGFSLPSSPSNLLLVAGGRGVAPLIFLAEKALSQGHKVVLLLGAPTRAELYPRELLPSPMELVVTTEDGSEGEKGVVTDLLPRLIPGADTIFTCGPLPMYRSIARQWRGTGKSIQVSLETRMGCGMGVCYSCTTKTEKGIKQVCTHGPVFELQDILWEEIEGQ